MSTNVTTRAKANVSNAIVLDTSVLELGMPIVLTPAYILNTELSDENIESATYKELDAISERIINHVKHFKGLRDIGMIVALSEKGEKVKARKDALIPTKTKTSSKMSLEQKRAKVKANNEEKVLESSLVHAMKGLGYAHKDIASDLGKSASHVQRLVKFHAFYIQDEKVRNAINEGVVSFSEIANETDLDKSKFDLVKIYSMIDNA